MFLFSPGRHIQIHSCFQFGRNALPIEGVDCVVLMPGNPHDTLLVVAAASESTLNHKKRGAFVNRRLFLFGFLIRLRAAICEAKGLQAMHAASCR